MLKTLVAFANTSGGTLLVGIDDGTRHVRGIPEVLKAEERLASLIADSIRPQIIPDMKIVNWRNLNFIVVKVYPSNTRPHHLAGLGADSGTFVRVGSSNRKAGPAQIGELKRLNRMHSFDEQAVVELNSEALDFRVASELFAQYKKLTPQAFKTLRVTTDHQGRQVPTIGGLLLFGRDKSRIADSVEIRSLLPIAVDEVIAFAQKHLMVESVIEGVRRQQRWSVPLVAIREAVSNAIVHADYSQHGAPIRLAVYDDRIEIDNPGLLAFGLTLDDLQQGVSKLRNRVIGRVFQELHLIEHWGSGIQRMNVACEEAGLPLPRLQEIGTHFRVTIYSKRVKTARVDPVDEKLLAILRKAGPSGTAAIARLLKRSTRAVLTRLKSLNSRGLVVKISTGPHDPKRKYAVATQSS